MKRDAIIYSVFIIATVLVAFVLIQSNKVSDEELFESALNDSDVSLCAKIDPDVTIDCQGKSDTKIDIQGYAILRDVCFSELAEPVDEKLGYCEDVSNTIINVCEPGGECFDMSAKEACYREVFKDYSSNAMPPQEGAITDIKVCESLTMFRDNCLYLYAITTGDESACELFDNGCGLRKQLCIDETRKVNVISLDLGDAVVYQST